MRKFISIDEDFGFTHHFPECTELTLTEVAGTTVVVLANFEEQFVFTTMATQAGTLYWVASYAPIDSHIEVEKGYAKTIADMEAAINRAMTKFTRNWRSELSLPPKQ